MIWGYFLHMRIDQKRKNALNTVVLYIPEKAQLSEAELQLSDGDFAADQLLCKEMTLELLSGDLMLDKGEFEKFDAKLSDGDLNVKELQCTDNMQLKSGNGDVNHKKGRACRWADSSQRRRYSDRQQQL